MNFIGQRGCLLALRLRNPLHSVHRVCSRAIVADDADTDSMILSFLLIP